MDRGNYEDNISVSIVTNAPQLTVQDAPTNTKVSIWGYELCNGTQWKGFLEVVNKLGKENEQLKQQLDEKDKEIKKLNWQLKDKDFIIKNLNHSLSVAPNANAGQRARIDELTKIVKEKDKEIETLKQELEEINAGYDFTYEQSTEAIKELKQNQTQLAIKELEKVKDTLKHFCEIHSDEFYGVKSQVKGIEQDVCEEIDNQIKVLKGE